MSAATVLPTPEGPGRASRYAGAFGSMLRSRWVTHRPFFLAHALTFGCNSRCQTCGYWKNTPRMKEDLTTPEVYALLDEAYDAGMRGYYLFGGEPLIRHDITDLVDYANRKGFLVTMNTNGSFLAAKAPRLRGLDFAFVSLDYPGPFHDTIRGRPGSFDEVMRGIDRLREETSAGVTLVTTISTLNRDAMRPMAELARRKGLTISFNSVEPTLDFGLTDSANSPNLRLGLTPEELQEFYRTLLALKREGYPLMESEQVLEDFVEGRPWKCKFPQMFVYVTPNKQIYTCDYRYGYDLKHGSFEEYFASPEYRSWAGEALACNRCIRTCVRGYSYTYDLKLAHLWSLASSSGSLFRSRPVPRPSESPAPSDRPGLPRAPGEANPLGASLPRLRGQ